MDKVNNKELQYIPLSLLKLSPNDNDSKECELRNHVGDCKSKTVLPEDDLPIAEDSIIFKGKQSEPIMLVCITMYNEHFIQLLESLAGVFRAYYELVNINEEYKDRVHVIIVADGYDKLSEEFLK